MLTEHPAEAFEIPPGKSERFTLVEVTMFAGRSLDAKRRLYRAVVRNLGRLGVPASDVLTVLHGVPLENWGIRGGTPPTRVPPHWLPARRSRGAAGGLVRRGGRERTRWRQGCDLG